MHTRAPTDADPVAGLYSEGVGQGSEHTGISLGIIGMSKRARSVGGQLRVGKDNETFSVALTLPLVSASSRAPLADVLAKRPAAQ